MEELNKERGNQLSEGKNVATIPEKSLDNAKSILEKNKIDLEKGREKIEKQLLRNEMAAKEEGEATKAKMEANNARAKLSADEAAAIAEYSEEYKKRLQKEEERRQKQERLERERERLLAEKEKSEQRQEKIEEFLRLEIEANEERELRSASLLQKLSSFCDRCSSEQGEDLGEKSKEEIEEKIDTPIDIPLQNTGKYENADEELVLKIGCEDIREISDEMTVKIGAFSVSAQIGTEEINEKIRIAETHHKELCRNAIADAGGVPEEEKRLLSQEDERYKAEIEELRARLDELSSREGYYRAQMQTFVPTAPLYFPAQERDFSYGDISALDAEIDSRNAEKAREKFGEAYLESDLITSFDKYQENNRRNILHPSGEYSDAFLYPEKRPEARDLRGGGGNEYLEEEYLRNYAENYREEYANKYSERYADGYSEKYGKESYGEYTPRYTEEQPGYERYDAPYYDYAPPTMPETPPVPVKEQKPDTDLFDEQRDVSTYHAEELSIFKKAELISRLDGFYRQEKALEKKITKIEASQKSAEREENIALIVEKIGVEKEICELSIEALNSAVYADVRSRISRQRKNLEGHIDRYNLFCDEYETATGRPLERLSGSLVRDAVAGKICKPIPNVYYHGEDGDNKYGALDAKSDKAHRLHIEESILFEEYDRYLEDGARVEFLPDSDKPKQKSDKMSKVRYATERDILLIGLRNEYKLSVLEAKRDVLMHSFGSDTKKLKELEIIDGKIEKLKKSLNRSLKIERSDNARFYLLPLLDPFDEKTKKRARKERLNALRTRLNVLLSEREDINERLIALYGGSDKKLAKIGLNRKVSSVRRKSAKAMRRRQQQLARIINKYKAPEGMKEEAYRLLNKKIELVALADEARYKLKRSKLYGNAHRELTRTLRGAERDIRRNDKEIKFMIRRIKRYEEKYEDRKTWAKLLIVTSLVLALAVCAVFVWGDNIVDYFNDLISKFKR